MIGRAAQIAQPGGVERDVGDAGFAAVVKLLGGGLEAHAAAFQQQDLEFGVGEGERKRNSGRPAADNG